MFIEHLLCAKHHAWPCVRQRWSLVLDRSVQCHIVFWWLVLEKKPDRGQLSLLEEKARPLLGPDSQCPDVAPEF